MLGQRIGLLTLILSLCASCATQQPAPVATLTSNLSLTELSILLDEQTVKCWQREPGFWQNGIRVKSHLSVRGTAVITVAQWIAGGGPQATLAIVEIEETSAKTTKIVVSKTESAPFDVASDIKRWIDGVSACSETE